MQQKRHEAEASDGDPAPPVQTTTGDVADVEGLMQRAQVHMRSLFGSDDHTCVQVGGSDDGLEISGAKEMTAEESQDQVFREASVTAPQA